MTNSYQIATTIMKQLGKLNQMRAMVGIHSLTYGSDGNNWVAFGFKGSRKMNRVKITLSEMDLYNIEFSKFTRSTLELKVIEEFENIYGDQLTDIFETTTGLYLSL